MNLCLSKDRKISRCFRRIPPFIYRGVPDEPAWAPSRAQTAGAPPTNAVRHCRRKTARAARSMNAAAGPPYTADFFHNRSASSRWTSLGVALSRSSQCPACAESWIKEVGFRRYKPILVSFGLLQSRYHDLAPRPFSGRGTKPRGRLELSPATSLLPLG